MDGSIPTCAGQPADPAALPSLNERSIPTCAGQPFRHDSTWRGSSNQVYPHVCGAASFGKAVYSSRWSMTVYPHVCGAAMSPRRLALRMARLVPIPVYPHVCGAAGFILSRFQLYDGLSPRVRGSLVTRQPILPVASVVFAGLTPYLTVDSALRSYDDS